jgi:hypothetical protein
MMIDRIKSHPDLQPFLYSECCDQGLCLEFDDTVSVDDRVVIKVDEYYNAQDLGNGRPPSPDCLIIVRCKDGGYSLHVAELKNMTTAKYYDVNNVIKKFDTCFEDFIPVRFRDILFTDYKKVKLYFLSRIDMHTRDMGISYEILTGYRRKYNGKQLQIKAFIPIAKIKACY